MQDDAINHMYKNMSVTDCFNLYNDYWTPQGNALILVKNESVQSPANDSLLLYVTIIPRLDDWAKNMWALKNGSDRRAFTLTQPDGNITTWFLGPQRYEAAYCLVQPTASAVSKCRFEYSPQIMFTICILNFVKAAVMLSVWSLRKWQAKVQKDPEKEVLYTLGDAIASFMRQPDSTTIDMAMMTKEDFLTRRTWQSRFTKLPPAAEKGPRKWKSEPKLWMKAASVKRWLILVSAYAIPPEDLKRGPECLS